MPQPRKAPRFGKSPGHHNLMMSNLTTELIRHGRIRTTLAKAKTVQPLAEKMITHAKKGDLHARRQVLKVVRDKDVVHKLFAQVGPAFAEREGGYTRVLKLGPRKGDAAPMALIELVEGVSMEGSGELDEAPRRRWALRRRKGGTVSSSAREREEERLAAVDRGEDLEPALEMAEPEDDDLTAVTDEEPQAEATAVVDEGAPEADPAEVEARLAAQEQAETASDAGGDPDGDDDEGPITDAPVPSEEQDAPAPETMPEDDERS